MRRRPARGGAAPIAPKPPAIIAHAAGAGAGEVPPCEVSVNWVTLPNVKSPKGSSIRLLVDEAEGRGASVVGKP